MVPHWILWEPLIAEEKHLNTQCSHSDMNKTHTNHRDTRSCTCAQTHKHLSLSGTEDWGIESVHIWRGNRACGDSRVVGGPAGSRWCAAERNHHESRFLWSTGGSPAFPNGWGGYDSPILGCAADTFQWWIFGILKMNLFQRFLWAEVPEPMLTWAKSTGWYGITLHTSGLDTTPRTEPPPASPSSLECVSPLIFNSLKIIKEQHNV